MAKYDLSLLPLLLMWGSRRFPGPRDEQDRKGIQIAKVCIALEQARVDRLGLFVYRRTLYPT